MEPTITGVRVGLRLPPRGSSVTSDFADPAQVAGHDDRTVAGPGDREQHVGGCRRGGAVLEPHLVDAPGRRGRHPYHDQLQVRAHFAQLRRGVVAGGDHGRGDHLGPLTRFAFERERPDQQPHTHRKGACQRRDEPPECRRPAHPRGSRLASLTPGSLTPCYTTPRGLTPGGATQVGLGVRGAHDPGAQALGDPDTRHAEGEQVDHELQVGNLRPAGRALDQVHAEDLGLRLVERPQHVGRALRKPFTVQLVRARAHESAPSARSCVRIFCNPRRIRPLIVPTGVSSIAAISEWVSPP